MALIEPKSPFQEKYLQSNAKVLVVGGAAGSSKSYIGLMRHLRWCHDPFYRGFCIRKNSTAIMKEGGLFDEATALYRLYDPKIKIKLKDQKIVFSSGASVSFSHYEDDKAANLYQGLQLSNVFYDEASHADEKHIWWLVSRLRTKAKLNPSIWLSCNPDPDSYLFEWVKWWLYPEGHENYGLPDPEKNGVIRYVLRVGGVMCWGDTPEELILRYGKSDLPMDHEKQVKPIPFQCLFGTIHDNPTLIEMQPEYLANLESLPDVERRRLLLGDWTAREQSSTFFQRQWVEEILDYPHDQDILETVRAYDFAGTLVHDGNKSPDYTATVKMAKLRNGDYVILDIKRTRIRFGDWKGFVLQNAMEDDKNTIVLIPQDPNPAAKAAAELLVRELCEVGIYAQIARASTSKLDRFRPFSALAQNGAVKIVKGCGTDLENGIVGSNDFYYKELESFTGVRKKTEVGHDDMVDATSDCTAKLTSKVNIGNFLGGVKSMQGNLKEYNPLAFAR
jgi:predicted phage terminase large subunit-like protein